MHPVMRALPVALRARMDSLGHRQNDVVAHTGVPQPQVSRALNGERKRLTPAMQKLCQYAEIEKSLPTAASETTEEVAALLQHLIGDSASAAAHMKAVLRSLAPLMASYRRDASR